MNLPRYIPRKRTIVVSCTVGLLLLITLFVVIASADRHSPTALYFTDLTHIIRGTPPDPALYIRSIVITTNPADTSICSSERTAYAFVVTLTNETTVADTSCLPDTDPTAYLRDINTYLANTRGYPRFTNAALETIPTAVVGEM